MKMVNVKPVPQQLLLCLLFVGTTSVLGCPAQPFATSPEKLTTQESMVAEPSAWQINLPKEISDIAYGVRVGYTDSRDGKGRYLGFNARTRTFVEVELVYESSSGPPRSLSGDIKGNEIRVVEPSPLPKRTEWVRTMQASEIQASAIGCLLNDLVAALPGRRLPAPLHGSQTGTVALPGRDLDFVSFAYPSALTEPIARFIRSALDENTGGPK
jgi:hypothetical protein